MVSGQSSSRNDDTENGENTFNQFDSDQKEIESELIKQSEKANTLQKSPDLSFD